VTSPAQLPAPDRTIDTSGTLCPYPIVATARAVRAMEGGAVLLVVATDPGIAQDMPMWCKATRNEHLATWQEAGAWKSLVRKRAG
jgi:tRNA 2-thiouridine synthesizing protein A